MLIHSAPLVEISSALRTGKLDLTTHINQTCDLLDTFEPKVQALLAGSSRRERLMNDAIVLQKRFPHVTARPLLYGVLIGVKDIIRVDGFPTRAGSRLPPELFTGSEATCVVKLRNAGALILAKTVTTEFAYRAPGPTRNPHNLDHTPGGSSSGSAAAVAAGFCPLALGTQTTGSVIRPAAYCGIVGFKPSYGRISTQGVITFSESADHVGLFTQDVAGMRLAASLICSNWRLKENGESNRLPILGVPQGPYLFQASRGAQNAFETQLAELEDAGYSIRYVTAFKDIETINHQHQQMIAAEIALVHVDWFAQYEEFYQTITAETIRTGQAVSTEDLADARAGCSKLRTELEALMRENGIDLWVSPAAPGTAPKGIETTGDGVMNLPWTYAGLPVVTLPVGFAGNGLPLGLQVAASFMSDELLLSWADSIADHWPRLYNEGHERGRD